MKRGKPMKRGAPLRSKTQLRRGKRVAPRNAKRRAKLYARNFGERAAFVRSMECLGSAGCAGPIEAAHVRARGMGGVRGSRRDLVPLCSRHHAEAGEARTSMRRTFELVHAVDLTAEAARIAASLDEAGVP